MELTREEQKKMADRLIRRLGLVPFRRHRIFGNRWLPPSPVPQAALPWGWRDTFRTMTPGLWALAVAMLGAVLVGIFLLLNIPFLRLSPLRVVVGLGFGISGEWELDHFFGEGFNGEGMGSLPLWAKGFMTAGILGMARVLHEILPHAAMREEQHFREGSETWTQMEKTKASFAFGFAHLYNIIYPIGTCLALSAGGRIFMATYLYHYRRTDNQTLALCRAAALHNAYNLLALGLVLPLFLVLIWL